MSDIAIREQNPSASRPASLSAEGQPASGSPLEGAPSDNPAAARSENAAPQTQGARKSAKTQPRKGGAAARRKRAQRIHSVVRFCVQIAFFVLAPGLFSSALGGVKYLCAQVGALELIEPTAFVASLAFAVGFTVAFGRFFCGYACAFGTMGDVLYALAAPLRRALRIPSLQDHPRLLAWLQALKLAVLAGVCALCFTGVWDAVSAWDPWAVFGKVTSGADLAGVAKKGAVVLLAIMVLQALFERSFCRFLCPMGALFSLLPVLPFSVFNRYRPSCAKKCNRCQDACPVDIHPDQSGFHSGECIACGRCAAACPLGNVNLAFVPEPADVAESPAAKPSPASKEARVTKKPGGKPAALVKIKGSGAGWVAVKAAILLVLCWLAGLVRFVPSPADIPPFGLPWL